MRIQKIKNWHFIKKKMVSNIYTPIIFLVTLTIITHWQWFISWNILVWGDWGTFVDSEPLRELLTANISWRIENLGSQNATASFAPVLWLMGMLAYIGEFSFVERFAVLIPSAIFSTIGSYLLVRKISGSIIGGVVGSLVYSYNVYALILQSGHVFLYAGVSLFPICLLIYWDYLNKLNVRMAIVSALMLSILAAFEFRVFYIFCFVSMVFMLWKVWISEKKHKGKLWLEKILKSLIPLFIVGVINFFWLIGTYNLNAISSNEIFDRPLFGEQFLSLLWAMSLYHPFWSGEKLEFFVVNTMPLQYVIIPILSLIGLILNRKNPWVIFFGAISVLGILLTKQSDLPFQTMYQWLYENFPGFNAFREASKFYLLITLGYAVLIGSLVSWMYEKKFLIRHIATLAVCILFLANAKPLMTGEYGNLFVSREKPHDYVALQETIRSDRKFSRTLYYPTTPRWGFYDSAHPRASFLSLETIASTGQSTQKKASDKRVFFPNTSVMQNNISSASFRYVVIPNQDIENDDDFFQSYGGEEYQNIRQWYIDQLDTLPYLKRIDIGTEELAVYENEGYLPYVRTGTSLIEYENSINLENKYLFTRDILNFPFGFVVPKDTKLASYPQTTIFHLYENIAPTNIRMGAITTKPNTDSESETLYVNTNAHSIEYTRDSNSLVFYKKYAPGIRLGGGNNSIDAHLSKKAVLAEVPTTNNEYIGVQSGSILSLQQTESSKHLASTKNMTVYRVEKINAITNASFENGLWQETVGDCNNHDDNPILDMSLSSTAYRSSSSLELMATRHIACTNTYTEPLEAGSSYLFSFAYQGDPAQQAGFHLSFGKGMDTNTVVSERLPISEVGNKWQEFSRILRVPEGAERAQLHLYAYATDNETANIVRYDAIRFAKIQEVAQVGLGEQEPNFEAIPLPSQESYEFTFSDPAYSMENLISNPSLEDGLWSKRVGDCNNHDDNPILDMRLSDIASDNNHSIELSATRHIACTGPRSVPVTNGSRYLLSFDYQGEGAKEAGYYIGFSGSNSPPSKNERIVISKDAERSWKTYTKIIDVPEGAQNASLLVYAYATNGKQKNIVRYDNFSLIELPPIHNRYYLVSDPETNFVEPREITFDLINPTKKLVHIKGATTPFYLAMSESYHPEWQAHLSNAKIGTEVKSEKSKVKSKNESFDSELSTESSSLSTFDLGLSTFYSRFFASWIPWVKPDAISNDHHFELNGFLNGWYVDSSALCAEVPRTESQLPSTANTEERGTRNSELRSGCTQNPDGSYDIELTLEFFPQRWFYLGLLISGTTLLACLGYLAYDFARRRRAKRKSKVASPKSKGEIDRDRTV